MADGSVDMVVNLSGGSVVRWLGSHIHGLSVGSPQSKPPAANQNAWPDLTH